MGGSKGVCFRSSQVAESARPEVKPSGSPQTTAFGPPLKFRRFSTDFVGIYISYSGLASSRNNADFNVWFSAMTLLLLYYLRRSFLEDIETRQFTAIGFGITAVVMVVALRAIFDDFGEPLILAGNGHGIGAKKVLRSMYERLVTAMFMAKFPAEAKIFLAHSDIEKGKALNRAIATVLESVNRDFMPEQITRILDAKKAAEAKKKIEYCKACSQPKTDEAWTRVDLDAMARKVGNDLLKLYGQYYLVPTLLTHATPFGLDIRFRKTEAAPDFREY